MLKKTLLLSTLFFCMFQTNAQNWRGMNLGMEISSNDVISIVPTIDYYWNDLELRPSLGIGIGSYLLVGFLDIFQTRVSNPADPVLEVNVGHQLGLLMRGGFEWGNYRVGLAYNFTPIADVVLPNGQKVGTVDRRYFGLSLGFSL